MMTTECFLANFWNAAVLGPGMGSASLKYLWSSDWQKYSERNNSWVQIIRAPCFAARSASARVFLRLAAGSGEQEGWSSPSLTVPEEEERFMAGEEVARGRGGRAG